LLELARKEDKKRVATAPDKKYSKSARLEKRGIAATASPGTREKTRKKTGTPLLQYTTTRTPILLVSLKNAETKKGKRPKTDKRPAGKITHYKIKGQGMKVPTKAARGCFLFKKRACGGHQQESPVYPKKMYN